MLHKYKIRDYYSMNQLKCAATLARKKWSGTSRIHLGSSNQDCKDYWRGGVKGP